MLSAMVPSVLTAIAFAFVVEIHSSYVYRVKTLDMMAQFTDEVGQERRWVPVVTLQRTAALCKSAAVRWLGCSWDRASHAFET